MLARVGSRWEVDDADWDRVRADLRNRLESIARQGVGLIFYGDLVRGIPEISGPDSHALHAMLGEMSTQCHAEKMPLLSALVITKDTKRPGKGFYQLAEGLGVGAGVRNRDDQDLFWAREVRRCYDAWSAK